MVKRLETLVLKKGPIIQPACLGCLRPFKGEPIYCPKCNLPLCSLNCDYLSTHETQECSIFSEAKLVQNVKVDTTKPNSLFNCIALMRIILKFRPGIKAELDEQVACEEVKKLMTHLEDR